MPYGFLDRLVDWRDFEMFVRDLYATHPDLDVEHNVTEVGKSGAARQIDIKFTHRAGGHTYVTLVECKRWKEKVSRDRIDVLVSSMKDLNAAKGVMFTTAGYEPGAEAYASHEGVELFMVRDLTDQEWGSPGRVIWFWMHYYSGQMTSISSGRVEFLSSGDPPEHLALDLRIGPDVPPNPATTLFSISDGSPGPNLLDLFLEARARVLKIISQEHATVFEDGTDGALKAFMVPVRLDLSRFPYRDIRQQFGLGRLEAISMELLVTVTQRRFEYDRSADLDLAVAVENFMTRQRQVVTRSGGTDSVDVFEIADEDDRDGAADDTVLENGMLMQIFLEAWVNTSPLTTPPRLTRSVAFELPDWDVVISEGPGASPTPPAP